MAGRVTLVIPQQTVVYAGVALVVAVIVILNVYAFFISGSKEGSASGKSIENTAENFASAKAAEIPNDKCKAPPGYTEEEWREHMGHHPDQYGECL